MTQYEGKGKGRGSFFSFLERKEGGGEERLTCYIGRPPPCCIGQALCIVYGKQSVGVCGGAFFCVRLCV